MREILVTGASGFLGRHVCRAAAGQGFLVTGIGHGAWREAEAAAWGVARWQQDDVTAQRLARLELTPEVIVHCAGSGTAAGAYLDPGRDFARSVGATVEVLEFIRRYAPESALVYPSSGAVYGRPAQMPVPETAPAAPVNPYGVHKHVAEMMVASYARHFGVRAGIVRLFSLYGSELRKQLLWDACVKSQRGDVVFGGTGTETRDWVSVEDAAALILLTADHAERKAPAVNCAAGIEVNMHDVLAHLLTALGVREAPRFTGTRREGDLARYAGDPASALAWGWRPQQDWRGGIAEYAAWFLADQTGA